jgi:hypothetical protein
MRVATLLALVRPTTARDNEVLGGRRGKHQKIYLGTPGPLPRVRSGKLVGLLCLSHVRGHRADL